MHLDSDSPLNAPLLCHLSGEPTIAAPDSSGRDPYMGHGSHPDIVARVWDEIGPALPVDCRCLLHRTPALVAPISGIILAFAWGTQYVVRLPLNVIPTAIKAGAKTKTKWSNKTTTDVAKEFGPDWIFGAWLKDEPKWCLAVYETVEKT